MSGLSAETLELMKATAKNKNSFSSLPSHNGIYRQFTSITRVGGALQPVKCSLGKEGTETLRSRLKKAPLKKEVLEDVESAMLSANECSPSLQSDQQPGATSSSLTLCGTPKKESIVGSHAGIASAQGILHTPEQKKALEDYGKRVKRVVSKVLETAHDETVMVVSDRLTRIHVELSEKDQQESIASKAFNQCMEGVVRKPTLGVPLGCCAHLKDTSGCMKASIAAPIQEVLKKWLESIGSGNVLPEDRYALNTDTALIVTIDRWKDLLERENMVKDFIFHCLVPSADLNNNILIAHREAAVEWGTQLHKKLTREIMANLNKKIEEQVSILKTSCNGMTDEQISRRFGYTVEGEVLDCTTKRVLSSSEVQWIEQTFPSITLGNLDMDDQLDYNEESPNSKVPDSQGVSCSSTLVEPPESGNTPAPNSNKTCLGCESVAKDSYWKRKSPLDRKQADALEQGYTYRPKEGSAMDVCEDVSAVMRKNSQYLEELISQSIAAHSENTELKRFVSKYVIERGELYNACPDDHFSQEDCMGTKSLLLEKIESENAFFIQSFFGSCKARRNVHYDGFVVRKIPKAIFLTLEVIFKTDEEWRTVINAMVESIARLSIDQFLNLCGVNSSTHDICWGFFREYLRSIKLKSKYPDPIVRGFREREPDQVTCGYDSDVDFLYSCFIRGTNPARKKLHLCEKRLSTSQVDPAIFQTKSLDTVFKIPAVDVRKACESSILFSPFDYKGLDQKDSLFRAACETHELRKGTRLSVEELIACILFPGSCKYLFALVGSFMDPEYLFFSGDRAFFSEIYQGLSVSKAFRKFEDPATVKVIEAYLHNKDTPVGHYSWKLCAEIVCNMWECWEASTLSQEILNAYVTIRSCQRDYKSLDHVWKEVVSLALS